MTEFLFADNYDFNNPRGVFSRTRSEVEAEPTHYPQEGEDIIFFTEEDGESFGIVVTVTKITKFDDHILYATDYPERTWRKGRTDGTESQEETGTI